MKSMKHFLLIITLLLFTRITSAEEMRIVFATGEWPPFSSKHLPEYGRASALVSAICKAAGIHPVFEFYPWKRAELLVAKGEIFAAFPYAISEERKDSYHFSETLFHGVNMFLYYDQNPRTKSVIKYDTIEDLRGYRIGVISGSFLSSTFEKANLIYESTTSIDQSIHKLVAGRLDFYIDDRVVLYDAVQRLYPDKVGNFKLLPKSFGKKTPTGLLISRTYPEAQGILDKFNKGLAIIRKSGEYDRIVQKYRMTR